MKLFFNILKFRLLGYYHSYGQDMKPELVRVKEANDLARLLDASVGMEKTEHVHPVEAAKTVRQEGVIAAKKA